MSSIPTMFDTGHAWIQANGVPAPVHYEAPKMKPGVSSLDFHFAVSKACELHQADTVKLNEELKAIWARFVDTNN